MIRYPSVTIAPVSPRTPQVVDVMCSSCGMLHAAIFQPRARKVAADHRDLHLAVACGSVTIAAACAVALWYAAWLLGVPEAAGAVVGATIGLVAAVRVLSPARWAARQRTERRSDA